MIHLPILLCSLHLNAEPVSHLGVQSDSEHTTSICSVLQWALNWAVILDTFSIDRGQGLLTKLSSIFGRCAGMPFCVRSLLLCWASADMPRTEEIHRSLLGGNLPAPSVRPLRWRTATREASYWLSSASGKCWSPASTRSHHGLLLHTNGQTF